MYLPKVNFFGVNIPEAFEEYIVVRMTKILPFTKDLILMPVLHGYLVLSNTINKTVLWRVPNVDFPSEDPPINATSFEAEDELPLDPFVPLES